MYKVIFENGRVFVVVASNEYNAMRVVKDSYPDLAYADVLRISFLGILIYEE